MQKIAELYAYLMTISLVLELNVKRYRTLYLVYYSETYINYRVQGRQTLGCGSIYVYCFLRWGSKLFMCLDEKLVSTTPYLIIIPLPKILTGFFLFEGKSQFCFDSWWGGEVSKCVQLDWKCRYLSNLHLFCHLANV